MPVFRAGIGGLFTAYTTGNLTVTLPNATNLEPEPSLIFIQPFSAESISPATGTERNVCRKCHVECKYGCRGPAKTQCIHPYSDLRPQILGCKNVQHGLENGSCKKECDVGYFRDPRTEAIRIVDANGFAEEVTLTWDQCEPCHPACKLCGENDVAYYSQTSPTFQTLFDGATAREGYMKCLGTECGTMQRNGKQVEFFKLDQGLGEFMCLEFCPPEYQIPSDGRKLCVEPWTIIGYQDRPLDKVKN